MIQKHYGFAQVPRLVTRGEQYKHLSLAEKGLYSCLKDICGDSGECYYSLRNLAQEIGSSKSTLSLLIPKLVKATLITAEKKPNNRGPDNWHIRIVDIWEANDTLYRPADLSKNRTSLSENRTTDNEIERGLSENRTKEEEKKNQKEGEGTPPPSISSSSLSPSDIQSVIDNWYVALGGPVPLNDALIKAAKKLAPLHPSVDDLRSVKQFCLKDNPGWYGENGQTKGKVILADIVKNWEGWQSAQQTRQTPVKGKMPPPMPTREELRKEVY